jgi:hypothetical protein
VDGQLALALAQDDAHVVVEAEAVSSRVELGERRLEGTCSRLGLWFTNDHNRLGLNYSQNEKRRAIRPAFSGLQLGSGRLGACLLSFGHFGHWFVGSPWGGFLD